MNIDLQIKQHKHIIVCGDNRNSLSVVRSLGEMGIEPIVLLSEGRLKLVSYSKYAKNIIVVNSFEEVIKKLYNFVNPEYPPILYFTDDNHLQFFDEKYELFKDKFYFFNAASSGRLTYFLQKEHQCSLAKQCGLSVPNYEEVAKGEFPTKLSYPLITKTWNSYSDGWKRDDYICYSQEELQSAYQHMVSERLLLQEYVEKTGEYFLQGISVNKGQDVYIPFEARYLNYSATSFGDYMQYRPFENKDLLESIQKMLRAIEFSGCFEVEFLIDHSGNLHFLEVNFRFSGANYGVNIGGVNLPYLWGKSSLLGKIELSGVCPRRDAYYMVNDFSYVLHKSSYSVFTWLKQLFSADGYYLYNSKDMKPFYNWWIQKIKRKLSVPRA